MQMDAVIVAVKKVLVHIPHSITLILQKVVVSAVVRLVMTGIKRVPPVLRAADIINVHLMAPV